MATISAEGLLQKADYHVTLIARKDKWETNELIDKCEAQTNDLSDLREAWSELASLAGMKDQLQWEHEEKQAMLEHEEKRAKSKHDHQFIVMKHESKLGPNHTRDDQGPEIWTWDDTNFLCPINAPFALLPLSPKSIVILIMPNACLSWNGNQIHRSLTIQN